MPLDMVRAESVGDAAALIATDAGARFLGGGTLLMRDYNGGDLSIRRLVLADGLGLSDMRVAVGVAKIGAAATMAAVAAHPDLGFLGPVAGSIGGPAIRNMATIGGNLFAPYPYGDFAVALLALGASLEWEGADGGATSDIEAFLAADPRIRRIVSSVSFPLPPAGAFRFSKIVRRKPHGASVLSIAATLALERGTIRKARVAYGAMASTPIRARAVEAAIEGRTLDAETIAEAMDAATKGCAPLTDAQASDWYRRAVLPVHLGRLLRGEAGA